MEKRQKYLLGFLAALMLFLGYDWGVNNLINEPRERRERQIKNLKKQLGEMDDEFNKVSQLNDRMERWESQSLPRNAETARSAYQAWLLDVVARSGLTSPNVDSRSPTPSKGGYRTLSFSLRIQGTLNQLTQFLYEFYRADYLHKIESIGITPIRKAGLLNLSISIEALSMNTADRRDRLSTGISNRLASPDLSAYSLIARRNVFGIGGEIDEAAHTYLTGILLVNGQPEAWFALRATDRILKLGKGQLLEVGQFSGMVAEIEGKDVVLEADGERWLISVGENLDQAFALPPEF